MSFQWPEFLWALAGLPLLVFSYVWILKRKQKQAIRYASLALVRDAMAKQSAWRRHVPPLLFLLALACMIVAAARPSALMTLPSQSETIVLAMDVSGSMRAADVQPNRLVASQTAAKSFVTSQPENVRIGVVAFTDGQRTTGPDSLQAARLAAERGVRIYTVGFGTTQGEVIGFEGWSMRVRLDEETLKGIADLTRGEYFHAGSALDLQKVYDTLRMKITLETKKTEISALFAAAAAAIALLSAVLSLAWFHRIF